MEDDRGSAAQGGALAEAIASWVGARIDAAHANPATGLVALAVYAGARRVLGVGIGPRVRHYARVDQARDGVRPAVKLNLLKK
ncbi:hypothetical protein ACMHYB_22505 [Sorangium sp. So ce1128]